jgi:hypothetical protein
LQQMQAAIALLLTILKPPLGESMLAHCAGL